MTSLTAAGGMHSFGGDVPLLTLVLAAPIVGAAVVAMLPRAKDRVARAVAGGAGVVTLLLAALLLAAFDRHDGGYQFVSQHEWIPAFGVQWKLGVDGISLFLVALTALIFPLAIAYQHPEQDAKGYYVWMLLLEAGCIGSFLALDLFLFFVCFESILVPSYFLIAAWGYARRSKAALKFFLYTFTGSVFLLVGILSVVLLTANRTGAPMTFDLEALQAAHALGGTEARWLFFAFAVAFAVKAPVFPLHTWSPDTYEQSPLAGAVVASAVMAKLGTYGFVRFLLSLFPDASRDLAPVMLTLAVIGMVYGAIVAIPQRNLKRLVAYASLSHLGFIVLGTFAFSSQALSGAIVQMVNHGITTAALFLLIGMIYARRSTSNISELQGLQKVAPVLAGFFTLTVMSAVGVPGLNGFIGDLLILLGTFVTHRWWAVVGVSAVVLVAVYLLWAYQRVFHGQPEGDNARIADLRASERWILVPLAIGIVLIGVYPKPILDRVQPSVDRLLSTGGGAALPAMTISTPAVEANR